MNLQQLGATVRERRIELGLNQSQIAAMSKLSRTTVNLLENGSISDIGFVKVGQLANVKLTAYDYSIFGSLVGKVVHIAPDSVSNEKGESFYVARIETSSSMEVRGNKFEVMPGMQAQVDIITGHRTIWEYLSKPLVAVKENAFRER